MMFTGLKASSTNEDAYVINDTKIEQMFNSSIDATLESAATLNLNAAFNSPNINTSVNSSDKSQILAIVLDLFVGGLGLHRAYLGTKTFTWVGYILTCGGIAGLVPLIDLFAMVLSPIDKFVDNSKFFMW